MMNKANFDGVLAPSITETGKSDLSPVWSNTSVFYNDSCRGYYTGVPKFASIRIDNTPIVIHPNRATGTLAPSFVDDFYNRIHISPLIFNVGNLVNEMFLEFKVFNAYFVNRELTDLLYSNFDGLELYGKQPVSTYRSLEEQKYTIKVTLNGPAKIDAALKFKWDVPTDNQPIRVRGSRSILLPFRGMLPFSVEYSWITSINNTRNKTENRSQLRKEPRMKVMFNAPMNDNKSLRIAENLAFGWLARQYVFPLWYDIQTISVEKDATFIECETNSHWFDEGMSVLLWKSYLEYELVEVSQIASNGVYLVRPMLTSLNNVSLLPTVSVETKSGFNITSNNYSGNMAVTFDVIQQERIGKGQFASYKGHELWLDDLQTESPTIGEQFSTELDVLDFKVGKWRTACYQKSANVTKTVGRELSSLAELREFKEWLWRRAGRYSAFWVPTYRADLNVISKGMLASSIECTTDGYLGVADARKNAMIVYRKADGSEDKMIRGIVGSAAQTQTTMTISFDKPLGIDASQVKYISMLTLNRLASDAVQLNWETSGNVTCYMPIVEIDQ